MSNLHAHEPSMANDCKTPTDEQATSMGSQLHLLDLLIEFIDCHSFSDLHIEEYAKSLIYPAASEWPFSVFPDENAVQDMYMHRGGMYAYYTFQTRNGTWTQ